MGVIECQCGQKSKFPDSSAGKKARCSRCGRVVTIPGGKPVPTGVAYRAPAVMSRAAAAARVNTPAPSLDQSFDFEANATGLQPPRRKPVPIVAVALLLLLAIGATVALATLPRWRAKLATYLADASNVGDQQQAAPTAGPATAPTAPRSSPAEAKRRQFDGTWRGRASDGKHVTFVVEDGWITFLDWHLPILGFQQTMSVGVGYRSNQIHEQRFHIEQDDTVEGPTAGAKTPYQKSIEGYFVGPDRATGSNFVSLDGGHRIQWSARRVSKQTDPSQASIPEATPVANRLQFDGTWQGRASDGKDFMFIVKDGRVIWVDLYLPEIGTRLRLTYHEAYVGNDIREQKFRLEDTSISTDSSFGDTTSYTKLIEGSFDGPDQATGSNFVSLGGGHRAEWTARRVSDRTDPPQENATATPPVAARTQFDGTWQGKASDGKDFKFVVKDGWIVFVDWHFPNLESHESTTFGVGFRGNEVKEQRFRLESNDTLSNPVNGDRTSYTKVIEGSFIGSDQATGSNFVSLQGGHRAEWTARRVSDRTDPP
jgi:hypothetical protein